MTDQNSVELFGDAQKRIRDALSGLPSQIFAETETQAPTPSVPAQPAAGPTPPAATETSVGQTVVNLEHIADRFDTVLARIDAHRGRLESLADWLNHHTIG